MSDLKVGFSAVNINPPLGIAISGYFIPRYAKGVLDNLEVRTMALSCKEETIFLVSVASCGIEERLIEKYKEKIEAATGISGKKAFIAATHTHTGGMNVPTDRFEVDEEMIARYAEFLGERIADSAYMAMKDLKPAKMGYIIGHAPERVAYIRRYKMKDGSTYTCPPINDPNIDYPLGELDQRVNILRFDRESAQTIVLVNYGLHADTVNGEMISSDWPHHMYQTLEKALDGTKCIFFNGAEGDVGSTHVFPEGGDMNDTEISFDNEMKSPGMARFVGRAIAGTVLQVYDKVHYVPVDRIGIIIKIAKVDGNIPNPDEMPQARLYKKLHEEGRDDEIPFTGMQLTTIVADSFRKCRMEDGPEEFMLSLVGVRIGEMALIGIPGEPFTEIGVRIKEAEGWRMIMPCALANGSSGYFPVRSAYEEGGYEACTSSFRAGVDDRIVECAEALLYELKK